MALRPWPSVPPRSSQKRRQAERVKESEGEKSAPVSPRRGKRTAVTQPLPRALGSMPSVCTAVQLQGGVVPIASGEIARALGRRAARRPRRRELCGDWAGGRPWRGRSDFRSSSCALYASILGATTAVDRDTL